MQQGLRQRGMIAIFSLCWCLSWLCSVGWCVLAPRALPYTARGDSLDRGGAWSAAVKGWVLGSSAVPASMGDVPTREATSAAQSAATCGIICA